jgi:hypothetical protein
MKTIFASTFAAAILASGVAFANSETAHDGIPVLSVAAKPFVTHAAPLAGQLALGKDHAVNPAQSGDPARNAVSAK